MTIARLTDETFQSRIVAPSKPVLVEFGADWSAPCRQLEPVLESLAQEHSDRFDVAWIDVDDCPFIPPRFGVRGVPTLILFRDGAPVATTVGAMSANRLLRWIEDNI